VADDLSREAVAGVARAVSWESDDRNVLRKGRQQRNAQLDAPEGDCATGSAASCFGRFGR